MDLRWVGAQSTCRPSPATGRDAVDLSGTSIVPRRDHPENRAGRLPRPCQATATTATVHPPKPESPGENPAEQPTTEADAVHVNATSLNTRHAFATGHAMSRTARDGTTHERPTAERATDATTPSISSQCLRSTRRCKFDGDALSKTERRVGGPFEDWALNATNASGNGAAAKKLSFHNPRQRRLRCTALFATFLVPTIGSGVVAHHLTTKDTKSTKESENETFDAMFQFCHIEVHQ